MKNAYKEEECCKEEKHQVRDVAVTNELLEAPRCQGITDEKSIGIEDMQVNHKHNDEDLASLVSFICSIICHEKDVPHVARAPCAWFQNKHTWSQEPSVNQSRLRAWSQV